MELQKFLMLANKVGYSSGSKPKKLEDGSNEFVFQQDGLKYIDRYFAQDEELSGAFTGQEIVRDVVMGKVIWCRNYFGQVNGASPKQVYAFLRKTLSMVTGDKPCRGPSHFTEGDFEYADELRGDWNNFKGTEVISIKGKEVYRLEYHGGSM